MRLSAIFTSALRDDPGEGDQEAKKDSNPFQTNCRVVSDKEAILPSGSSADLCSISSADQRSSSSAYQPLSFSAAVSLS
jgi:hypothetical protein